jgi:hypothetical protein
VIAPGALDLPDQIRSAPPLAAARAQLEVAPVDLMVHELPVSRVMPVAGGGIHGIARANGIAESFDRTARWERKQAPRIYGVQETGMDRLRELSPAPGGGVPRGAFTTAALQLIRPRGPRQDDPRPPVTPVPVPSPVPTPLPPTPPPAPPQTIRIIPNPSPRLPWNPGLGPRLPISPLPNPFPPTPTPGPLPVIPPVGPVMPIGGRPGRLPRRSPGHLPIRDPKIPGALPRPMPPAILPVPRAPGGQLPSAPGPYGDSKGIMLGSGGAAGFAGRAQLAQVRSAPRATAFDWVYLVGALALGYAVVRGRK